MEQGSGNLRIFTNLPFDLPQYYQKKATLLYCLNMANSPHNCQISRQINTHKTLMQYLFFN